MPYVYQPKHLAIVMTVFCVALVGTFLLHLGKKPELLAPEELACTEEAMICPDGSAVGRAGPRCEFAPCPALAGYGDWKTYVNTSVPSLSFKYPEQLTTTYIHAVTWPPIIEVIAEKFECKQGGSEIAAGGKTELQVINSHVYCVTKMSEGAAGSIYNTYAYTWIQSEKTIRLKVQVRATQCGNYDEKNEIDCEKERADFDVNLLVDRIAQSVQLP